MLVRPATLSDAPLLAGTWYAMLDECGLLLPVVDPGWRAVLESHFTVEIERGTQRWLIAEEPEGTAVATGGAFTRTHAAAEVLTGRAATLAGIYTFPQARRRGYARAIVLALLEICRERGCRLVRLRPSAQGRPLYESLGFRRGDEMELAL